MSSPAQSPTHSQRLRWRRALVERAQAGDLSSPGLSLALSRLGILPDAAGWRLFADRALLAAGTLLILAGIVFFFAYNWTGLHRFLRIALVALPLLGSALAALYCARQAERVGRHYLEAALGAGVVLIGVLLAVVGQIYQTGADSELLFAGWALFALPWVLVASVPWLWLFWLLLVNVALGLYLAGRADIWAMLNVHSQPLWWPLLLNAGALALWEGLAWRGVFGRTAYGPRCVAFLTTAAATVPALAWVFRGSGEVWPGLEWVPLYYGAWAVAVSLFYRFRVRDIVPLALLSGSLVCVLSAMLARQLFEGHRTESSSFLLLGLAIAGMSAAATAWMRHTARQWALEAGAPDKGTPDGTPDKPGAGEDRR